MARLGEYFPGKYGTSSRDLEPREHGSECVQRLEYDIERQQMTIHFVKRGSYVFFDVDPAIFAEFNLAGSRGTYFNLYIRQAGYAYERIG